MVESHELLRKLGLFFIILGIIIGFIGAAASFVWGWGLMGFFYLGFVLTLIGFVFAVLSKV